jgi:Predicted transcriptional regulators
MFNQVKFGEKLKLYRKEKKLTQNELSAQIGVSSQAISKWEKGECLPDVYNLKLLGQIFKISVDTLLETEKDEKIIETYKIKNAVFELIEKPLSIYVGKMTEEINDFVGEVDNYDNVVERVLPERDIHISLNFWSNGKPKKIFFGRETITENQPDGLEVYKMPAGLFLRAYTDKNIASIIRKDKCEPWELFSYMWNYVMPKYNLKEARNTDGEDNQIEIYDVVNGSHGNGWAYAAVERTK